MFLWTDFLFLHTTIKYNKPLYLVTFIPTLVFLVNYTHTSFMKALSVEGLTKLLKSDSYQACPDLFCTYFRFNNETCGMYTNLFDLSLLNAKLLFRLYTNIYVNCAASTMPVCLFVTEFLPLLQLCHVKETVSVFSGQLKLRRQWEHGLIEVPQNSFDRVGVFMAVVNVIIQADKLPVVKKKKKVG